MIAKASQSTLSEKNRVLTAIKTSATDRASSAVLPDHITLADTVRELLSTEPETDSARRVLEQVRREVAGPHDFFVATRSGEMVKVDPRTRLSEIAVPRELRMADGGIKEVPVAAVEIQQYAEVGTR